MSSEADSFSPLASVVFIGIAEFTRKPVLEQANLRSRLEAAVAAATAPLEEADRAVLDAPDGAAIVVLGNVPGALQAAEAALAAAEGAPIGVSINFGPVTLVSDRDDSRLIGDGIDAAISIAGFTSSGGLMVSRSFRDALAATTPGLAAHFCPAGVFTDANVRSHELFSLDAAAQRAKSRRFIAFAALACLGILALGVGAKFALQRLVESRQPAFLVFDVRPQGEIYLDGVMKGKAPATTRLQVAAGAHTIELRNGKFPPFITEVSLSPGEEIQVKHSFTAPAAKKNRGLMERLKFW